MTTPLAPWPTYRDFAVKHGPTSLASELYNNALAAAWEARARLALEALEKTYAALGLYRRHEDVQDSVHEALAAIGPLPPLPDLPTAEKGG